MSCENENKWMVTGTTGYSLIHHGWRKGEEQFRNQFSFGLQYDRATVTEEEAEEKAAFIVRAINSHDALVDALRTLVDNGGIGPESMFYFARKALAEAEKP